MKFNGFQKLTLLDFPGKVACVVFTAGCNFRCPFCHNASLVTHIQDSTSIDEEEILTYLKKRKGLLDGVCITGGEPLMHPDIEQFIRKVRELGLAVKVDTNGCYPERLKSLIDQGLVDYVAMDIKNRRERYAETAGVPELDLANVDKSIALLREGRVDYEFRTTVVQSLHTVEDIDAIAHWIQGAPRYFLQNFTDSGDILAENMMPVSVETLRKMAQTAQQSLPCAQLRGVD